MNKKVILGTLLASATLCAVASTQVDAATSGIKTESKKITVTSKSARLFKDSKLKSSTTSKQGTVYQVDGYRNINGKHYYRLYQNDANNQKKYRGYMYSGYAKDLKMTKTNNPKYIAKNKATLWNDLYFAKKKTVLKEEKVYFTKGYYTLGNGKKYYSIYQKDSKNKDKWCGYTYSGNLTSLKMTKEEKVVTLTKDYSSWNDLYFAKKKKNYDYKKGVAFQTKGYYKIGGKKFYSVKQPMTRVITPGNKVDDAVTETVDNWQGYLNGSALREVKKEKTSVKYAYVNKWYNIYKTLWFDILSSSDELNSSAEDTPRIAEVNGIYTLGNGKKYVYMRSDISGWGYINMDALTLDHNKLKNYYIDMKNKRDQFFDTAKETYDKLQQNKVDEDDVKTAQTKYNQAKTKYNNTKNQLNQNKKELSSLTGNTFKLNQNYMTAIKKYKDNKTTQNSNAVLEAGQVLEEKNKYHSSEADRNIQVNIKKIDNQTMAQLAVFANEMSNTVRTQLGTNRTEATKQMQAVTKQLIKYYNDDNWDAFGDKNGHDTEALNKIMKEAGLHGYGEEMGSSIFESYYPWKYEELTGNSDINNLDFLKFCVYETMKSMLFDDAHSEWGHAFGLSGVGENTSGNNPTLMGFDVDKYGNTHFFIADGYANKGSKITDQNSPLKSDNEAKITELKETIKKQEAKLNTLSQELQTAKQAYDEINEKNKQYQSLKDQCNDAYWSGSHYSRLMQKFDWFVEETK